jgi:hypothetical protein
MKLHRIAQLTAVGVVAAAVAVPVGQAASNDRVQVAGSLVAPGDVSKAQLEAGHAASTRMVQIGGALVAPSQISTYESRSGGTAATGTSDDSSSGIGTGSIAALIVLGAFAAVFVGSALVLRRHRHSPATAS